MSYFYLVASLPTLSPDVAPPFGSEEFRLHCQGVLSMGDLEDLRLVLEGRARDGVSEAARKWGNLDTQVRNAVARARAGRYGQDPRSYLQDHEGFDVSLEKGVAEAFSRPNALEREEA